MSTRFNGFTLEELNELKQGLDELIVSALWINEGVLNVVYKELEQEIKSRK